MPNAMNAHFSARKLRVLFGALFSSSLCTPIALPQARTSPEPPDYRPSVEAQHEDLVTARSYFKTNILRKGPPPTEWDDLVTPDGAAEVVYTSGDLKLKA